MRPICASAALAVLVAACDSPEERLQSHYEDAQELLQDGELAQAQIEYRNAIQIDPDHVPSLVGLSFIKEQQSDYRGAAGLLRKALDLEPRHLEANIRFGRIMLLAGRLDEALEHSDTALEIDPESPHAMSYRASVMLSLDDAEGAVDWARKALERDPANIEATSVLAAERIKAGKPDEAIAILDRNLEGASAPQTLQLIKLEALSKLNAVDEIEDLLKHLVAVSPNPVGFQTTLVRFYLGQKRYDAAETQLRLMAEAEPDNPERQLALVEFTKRYRTPAAAEAALKRLVGQGDANVATYRLALADFYRDTEQPGKAEETLREAIAQAPSREEKLAAQTQLAEFIHDQGDVETATALVAEVLDKDKRNSAALLTRARIALAQRRVDDAVVDLRTVLRDHPKSVGAHMLLGRAHTLDGAPGLAQDAYMRAFRESKATPKVGLPVARFLMSQRHFEAAEDIITQVLRRNQDSVESYRALAQIRIARQDWIGAEEAVATLKRLNDDASVVGQFEGQVLQGQNRMSESALAFKRSHMAAPEALRPMASLVRIYMASDQPDRAEQFLVSVLENDQDNLHAQILLARLYAVTGRLEQAEKLYKRSIKAQPDNALAYASYFSFLRENGRADDANAVIDKGLEALPGNTTLALLKGQILGEQGKLDEALSFFEAMYEANQDSPVFVNNYASMLTDARSDRKSAERALEIAKSLTNSPVPQFQDTVGWIYYRLGRHHEAVDILEDAAAALPDLPIIHYHLGMTYEALNREKQALQALQRAADLSGTQGTSYTAHVMQTIRRLQDGGAETTRQDNGR